MTPRYRAGVDRQANYVAIKERRFLQIFRRVGKILEGDDRSSLRDECAGKQSSG